MVEPRSPVPTVRFIDNYCRAYEHLFSDVQSFAAFKYLHLGLVAPLDSRTDPRAAACPGQRRHRRLQEGQEHGLGRTAVHW